MRTLNIQTLSELSGVSAHTLRAWERRYNILKPQRSSSNRRMYSYTDLEKVRLLKNLTGLGIPISRLARLSLNRLKEEWTKLNEPQTSTVPIPVQHSVVQEDSAPLIKKILLSLQNHDLEGLDLHLNYARVSLGALRFTLEIASPIFQEVGKRVDQGRMSITQEHALSAIMRHQLTLLLMTLSPLIHSRLPKIAVSTKEGDYHEFGILLMSVLCAYEGFPVAYLGANVPPEPLSQALKALKVEYVILGSTSLPPEYVKLPLKKYLTRLRKLSPSSLSIWVGGENEGIPETEFDRLRIKFFENFEEALTHIREIKAQLLEK